MTERLKILLNGLRDAGITEAAVNEIKREIIKDKVEAKDRVLDAVAKKMTLIIDEAFINEINQI